MTVHKLPRIVYHPITYRVEYQEGIPAEPGWRDRRRSERRVRQPARRLVYKPVPKGGSSPLSSWATSSRPCFRFPVRSFPHAASGVRRLETAAPQNNCRRLARPPGLVDPLNNYGLRPVDFKALGRLRACTSLRIFRTSIMVAKTRASVVFVRVR